MRTETAIERMNSIQKRKEENNIEELHNRKKNEISICKTNV